MGKTRLVLVLDKSGSMNFEKDSTIEGFNGFIKSQIELNEDTPTSVYFFDSKVTLLADNVPIKDVTLLNADNYRPNGGTAMYDAIMEAITSLDYKADKDDKVIFAIITDGSENASKEHTMFHVKDGISKSKEKGWEFLFLASNIDVAETAMSIGISANRSVSFNTGQLSSSYAIMNKVASEYMSNGFINKDLEEYKNE